jgi:hypothetical protein
MRRVLLPLLLAILTLSACGGGGVKKRIFPPSASIQELAVQSDGSWLLKVRLQNFSNVTMRIDSLDAELRFGPASAGRVTLKTALDVGPESAEVAEVRLMPQSAAANPIQNALMRRRSVNYKIEGEIVSSLPHQRDDDFLFESQLTAVPGLTGVLR